MSGTLTAGQVLQQDRIAAQFGVSRMPVREALALLAARGLVDLTANRSARVAALTREDLIDIFDLRVAAETLAIRLALPQITNAQIDRAAALQAQIKASDVARFATLNSQFHQVLYAPCARPRLIAHIAQLALAADRYLRAIHAVFDYGDKSNLEHHALLSACHARDEAAAVACLERHITAARDVLADRMAQQD
ncbi:MAG: GntR family transcriptional regulator [Rhodobacteraceae bacterium]|nr:GntR family transcriptional regulator [Paracoccaceae bacterium]